MSSFITNAAEDYTSWVKGTQKRDDLYYAEHKTSIASALEGYKNLYRLRDIDAIIKTEKQVLTLYKRYTDSSYKNTHKKLADALNDITVMERCLDTVRSKKYKEIAETMDNKIQGIPFDGFHISAKSHITRLNLEMVTPHIQDYMKEEFRLRKENIKLIQTLYLNLQKLALDLIK